MATLLLTGAAVPLPSVKSSDSSLIRRGLPWVIGGGVALTLSKVKSSDSSLIRRGPPWVIGFYNPLVFSVGASPQQSGGNTFFWR